MAALSERTMTPTLIDHDRITADDASRLWERARYQLADPELRQDIKRRVDGLGDPQLAAMIDHALERSFPCDVLRAFQRELIPNLPTFAFERAVGRFQSGPDQWLRADPQRLADVVSEMALYSQNWQAIALSMATLSNRLGIADEVTTPIITAAIRSHIERHPQHDNRN